MSGAIRAYNRFISDGEGIDERLATSESEGRIVEHKV